MNDYYEELWRRMPADATVPDLKARLDFLLSEVSAGERVLDLGCGDGRFTEALARAGSQPVGVEVAEAARGRASGRHPGLDFRLAPIEGPLPLEDNSFDVVWASEVVEHVADTARWLSEVRRVLVPGGRLLLTTPDHGRLRIALGGIERFSPPLGDHLHLYTRRSLQDLLLEFGFGELWFARAGGPPLLRRALFARAIR
ncbi:MAG: class I SAM-dependent methyltransferase [Solirubrobacterales bacterium]|nr:class I SAM-dependent methyltransferase [Solirubrobacterales bacterium]